MNKKILIGIVAVVGLLLAIGILSSGGNNNGNNNDGEYNYSFSNGTSFQGSSGYTVTADEGKEFIFAEITLKNTNYSNGINSLYVSFKLNTDKFSYSRDSVSTFLHPDSLGSSITINKGSQVTFTVVFEVPLGTTGGTLVWDGIIPSKVVYNSSLV